MATNNEDHRTMEKELTCAVCGDVLRDPLELTCGHCFCKVCMEANTSGQVLKYNCGICDTPHNYDITALKPDIVLSCLAQNWRKWNDEILPNRGSRTCDICEETIKLMNCFFCHNCRVVYCSKCKDECHPSLGVLVSHKIEPLVDTAMMENESCSQHDKDFVYFCRKCVKPACSEKQCYESHKDHHMEMLPKVYKDELNTTIEKAKKARQKVRETIDQEKKLQTFLDKLQEVKDARIKCINESFSAAKQQVEDKRKELLADEEMTIGNRILNTNAVINEITNNNSCLNTLVSFAEKATEEEKKVPFLMMSSTLKAELDLYTAIDFRLIDDVSSIPTVPDNIELSRLNSAIDSLKTE